MLARQWQRAKAGEGRVVLVSGEPGIGKSRMSVALHAGGNLGPPAPQGHLLDGDGEDLDGDLDQPPPFGTVLLALA